MPVSVSPCRPPLSTFLAVIFLVSVGAPWARADEVKEDQRLQAALDAFGAARYTEALPALEPLAHAGRSEAQYLLGVAYERGFSVEPDLVVAQSWYLRSRQLHNRKAREAAARLAQRLDMGQSQQANQLARDERMVLDKDHGCMSFFGEAFRSHYVSMVQAQAPVEDMVEEILLHTGLEKNFNIRAASVPNAAAATQGGVRYLLYNPQFLDDLDQSTGTPWAIYSVMAHEIGHHLQGHTIQPGGSRPSIELEADKFSGFVLAQMGASLNESQIVMSQFGSPHPTATHPARDDRLRAIAEGWNNATKRSQQTAPPSSPPSTPARGAPPRGARRPKFRVPASPTWHGESVCETPYVTCPMAIPVPLGSVCYCPTRLGWAPGYSR